jgi:SAM-dependent methyltransferase
MSQPGNLSQCSYVKAPARAFQNRAEDFFARLRMARDRKCLMAALARRLRPYVAGAQVIFTPSDISLYCPDYVEPEISDRALVERIFSAFTKMKADHAKASRLYQPAPFWQRLVASYPLKTLSEMEFFLTNFGTWRNALALESSPLLHRLSKRAITRRYCQHFLFGEPLQLWQSLCDKPLSRLTYPSHGNQAGAFVQNTFVGLGSFDNEAYGTQLSELIRDAERPQVAELGAGYGKFAYFILRDIPEFSYIDFDLPEVSVLAAYYLMKSFPTKSALLYGEAFYSSSTHEQYDLIFMPPWEIEKLAEQSIDLFVNKNSLGEMSRDAAKNYLSHIGGASKWFFHLNHEFSPQPGVRDGLRACEYPLSPQFQLVHKEKDVWHELFDGRGTDIFAYLYCKNKLAHARTTTAAAPAQQVNQFDIPSIRAEVLDGWNVRLAFLKQWCPAGGRALDVGAHFGRYTLPLAMLANHVDAVDINPKFLEVLNDFACELKLDNISISSVDFISWSKGRENEYDFCLCTGTWYYLMPGERLAYLNSFRDLLTTDGVLLIDICADRYFLYRAFIQSLSPKARVHSLLAFLYRRMRRKHNTRKTFEREVEASGLRIVDKGGEPYYACRRFENFNLNTMFGNYWSAYILKKN